MIMNKNKFGLVLTAAALCLAAPGIMNVHAEETKEVITTVAYNQAETAHYDVVKRDSKAAINGKLDDKVWESVPSISGSFHYPWEEVEAPYTEFKAYHDGVNFYFSFVVKDKQVLAEATWKGESTVDNEDRVELFFANGPIDKPNNGMQPYYAIEVDPKGRVHDYSTVYYRHMDSEWNMDGLKTEAKITDDGYVVEGLIPLKTLNDLKLINDKNVMRTGIYRAEFSRAKGEKDITMQWISWVDPKTAEPDYHVDSSFGELRFLQK